MKLGSVCTGYGGYDLALRELFGAELVWWSDVDKGPIKIMTELHPNVPNIGDVKLVDWASLPPVDAISAGYPCQPFSLAGQRKGVDDPRHLWPWIARGIGILRPGFVFLENVPGHLRRGFDLVLSDLAALGYDAEWACVTAESVGAPHKRERLYVVATRNA